jgi:hypothetical protein
MQYLGRYYIWPTGWPGLSPVGFVPSEMRPGTEMKWAVLCWSVGPEVKSGHGPVAFKRIVLRLVGPYRAGRFEVWIYKICLFFL